MKIRKAIKQIVALGTGVTMLGATLFGASAAGLSDFPNPMFIDNGAFNGVIVVGDGAASSDVVGSIDVATSLQFSSTTTQTVSTGGSAIAPTVSDGSKLERSGNTLNFNETFAQVDSKLDKTDLPSVLADGSIDDTEGDNKNDLTYTQVLEFAGTSPRLTFDNDDDGDELAADYLLLADNLDVYKYELEFDEDLDYDNASSSTAAADLENVKISIQGNVYTITDVKLDADNGVINKMTLLAGETTLWMEEGVSYTKSIGGVDHVVVLQDVSESGDDKCGITVDGTLAWIDVGSTKTVNGVEIGVTDAITVHSEAQTSDVCEANLGAAELILEDGQEIEKDGSDVDGSAMYFFDDGGEWTGFNATFEAQDDEYIASGASWVDPVFGNFEFNYAGLTYVGDVVEGSASGDDGEIKWNNIDGKEIFVPFVFDDENNNIARGEKKDQDFLFVESSTSYACNTGTTNNDDCEGALLWVVDSGEAVHVMEIMDIKETSDKNETTLKDLTYGTTYTDTIDGALWDAAMTIELGAVGDITLTLTSAGNITTTNIDLTSDAPETPTGVTFELGSGDPAHMLNEYGVVFTEDNDDESAVDQVLSMNISADTTDEEIQFKDIVVSGGTAAWDTSNLQESEDNDDYEYGATVAGTIWKYDEEDDNDFMITFTEEQGYGNVFISPVGAEISSGAATDGETITVTTTTPIPVGTAKLASEIADVTAVNAIVVGGPCANAAAATLTGVAGTIPECLAGLEMASGEAIIKLYQNGGKVSLLVAGATADDTRRACRVLANADQYAAQLSGMEVKVTGTTMTDITVSAPTVG